MRTPAAAAGMCHGGQTWFGIDGLACRSRVEHDTVDPDWIGDALDLLLAERGKADRQFSFHVVVGRAGDGNATRFGQCLHPVGDVDAVAVDVVPLDDDVAKINANAEVESLFWLRKRHSA